MKGKCDQVDARALLDQANKLGISLKVVGDHVRYRPKSAATPEFLNGLRQRKAELIRLLTAQPDDACTCNPLPSQHDYGALAQAGVGPKYERCEVCGYTWQCKLCGGCRQCRSPNWKVKTILPAQSYAQESEE
jgi:hypothetical protein